MPKTCKHKLNKYLWREGYAVACVCAVPQSSGAWGCGFVLSMGPSNDEPAAVQFEMRAAEIVQDVTALGVTAGMAAASSAEIEAWLDHSIGVTADSPGWLARQIYPAMEPHLPDDVEPGPEQVQVPEPAEPMPDEIVETDDLAGIAQGDPPPVEPVELAEVHSDDVETQPMERVESEP